MKDHFVVFDFETNSFRGGLPLLHPDHHIVQVCMAAEGQTFQSLVRPPLPHIPSLSADIHRVTTARVANEDPFPEVWLRMVAWLETVRNGGRTRGRRLYLVAHNAHGFDVPLLRKEVAACQGSIPEWITFVDSLAYFKRTRPERAALPPRERPFALGNLYQDLVGRELEGAHDAQADVLGLRELLNVSLPQHGFRPADMTPPSPPQGDQLTVDLRGVGLWTAKKLEDTLLKWKWRDDGYKTIASIRAVGPEAAERALRSFLHKEPKEPRIRAILQQLWPSRVEVAERGVPHAYDEAAGTPLPSIYDVTMFYLYACGEDMTRYDQFFGHIPGHETLKGRVKRLLEAVERESNA